METCRLLYHISFENLASQKCTKFQKCGHGIKLRPARFGVAEERDDPTIEDDHNQFLCGKKKTRRPIWNFAAKLKSQGGIAQELLAVREAARERWAAAQEQEDQLDDKEGQPVSPNHVKKAPPPRGPLFKARAPAGTANKPLLYIGEFKGLTHKVKAVQYRWFAEYRGPSLDDPQSQGFRRSAGTQGFTQGKAPSGGWTIVHCGDKCTEHPPTTWPPKASGPGDGRKRTKLCDSWVANLQILPQMGNFFSSCGGGERQREEPVPIARLGTRQHMPNRTCHRYHTPIPKFPNHPTRHPPPKLRAWNHLSTDLQKCSSPSLTKGISSSRPPFGEAMGEKNFK